MGLNKKILIIDDEEGIRESLAGILEDEGYQLITASSGKDALNSLKNEQIDLVILDRDLAGMDGLTVLADIKKINPDLPVIMLSGKGAVEKAEYMEISACLEKPISFERLIDVVKRALANKYLINTIFF